MKGDCTSGCSVVHHSTLRISVGRSSSLSHSYEEDAEERGRVLQALRQCRAT